MAAPDEHKVPALEPPEREVGFGSGRRQDFTHRRFHGLRAVGFDLGRSLFIGALLEDCSFENVDFSRSDLSGTKMVRCSFKNCRFETVEIRSCRLEGVQFLHCDFRTAQFTRSDCRRTTFLSCGLEDTTLHEDRLSECTINDCRFERASVTSLEFDRCSFVETGLSNCTALFLFFDDCAFERFSMNAETIGLTYGLTRRDLDQMELIHLGDGQAKPADADLVDLLAATYRLRRWYVGVAAIELNFGLTPTVVSIRRLSKHLFDFARQGLPCDLDELGFIIRVLELLNQKGWLPLLAGRNVGRSLRQFLHHSALNDDERLARLIARVDRLTFSLLEEASSFERGGRDKPVYLEFHLAERPQRPLDALCGDILQDVLGPISLDFVSGREGSWFEVWQTLPSVVGTIQIVILAVSGSLRGADRVVQDWRRLVKTYKGEPPAAAKKIVAKRTKTTVAFLEADDGIATEITSARRRVRALSDQTLHLVDKTLQAVEAKSDQDLVDLQAYSRESALAVSVRPVRARPRRSPRKRAPAA